MNPTNESIISQVFEQFRDVFIDSTGDTVIIYVMVDSPNRDIGYKVHNCRERLCDLLPRLHTDIQIIDVKDKNPDELAALLNAKRARAHGYWPGDEFDQDHYRGHYVDLDFLD